MQLSHPTSRNATFARIAVDGASDYMTLPGTTLSPAWNPFRGPVLSVDIAYTGFHR
jgi:hypothetical protein